MLKSEFEKMTGIYLPEDMFNFIHKKYMDMEEDKQVFCRMYKNNEDGFAEKIQLGYEKKLQESKKADEEEVKRLRKQVDETCKALEKEQEWKDYYSEKMYAPEWYVKVANDAHEMNVEDAKKFISESFGFIPDTIEILDKYPMQQINRHGVIRNVAGKFFNRAPMYCSTDYNYILFKCSGYLYECLDGELYLLTE